MFSSTPLFSLGAADDSFSNSETFATTLIATDGAADSVSDGEAFRGTDDGADGTTVAPADYFAANHITATYSDSDHEYAYDVNSDVCSLRLAIITSGAKPYGAALQHAARAAQELADAMRGKYASSSVKELASITVISAENCGLQDVHTSLL